MSIHIITAENVREPLRGLLDAILERHIAHRLVDDFLVLTPDENSSLDLIRSFVSDPRLSGVLTGSSIVSLDRWISAAAQELEPGILTAPPWVHEALFHRLAEDFLQEWKPLNREPGLRAGNLSLSSLFQLITAFRTERMGSEKLRSFVAAFDPDLAEACVHLHEKYGRALDASPSLKDEAWLVERILRGLEKGETPFSEKLKTLYWLGFPHGSPVQRALMTAVAVRSPEIEQILLTQIPRGTNPQDLAATEGWEGCRVFPFQGTPQIRPEVRTLSFAGPFDEAGFILDEIVDLVHRGVPSEEIALFLPPEPFWRSYFSGELEKLGFLTDAEHPRPFSAFHGVRSTLSDAASPAEVLERTEVLLSDRIGSFQRNPSESLALEIRALHQWRETLEQVSFYSSETPELFSKGFSLSKIAQHSFLQEKRPPHRQIALRPHKACGLKTFRHAFVFQISDRFFPQGPERFFGFPLPHHDRVPAFERAQFQHLLGSAGEALILSDSTHSAQGEENTLSPYAAEFGFDPELFELKRHRPVFVSRKESPDFEKRAAVELQREKNFDGRFPHGGWMEGRDALELLREKLAAHVYTPRQLEDYALCPFKFLASTLLGLKLPLEKTPEGAPADRGDWIHRSLEFFFSKHREEIIQAGRNFSRRPVLLSLIPASLKTFSESYLKEKPWIHEILSEDFIARAGGALQKLLEDFWDRMGLSERPFVPAFFETAFGKDPPLVFEQGGQPPLRLKGRIDRIDVTEDGKEFAVFDYKTGDTAELSNEIKKFKSFQLPLYFLAAERILKNGGAKGRSPLQDPKGSGALAVSMKDLKIQEGFLRKEERKRFGFKGRTALWEEEEWEFYWRELKSRLFSIQEKILSGDFRPAPDPCDPYCDFRTICRYHERAKPHS